MLDDILNVFFRSEFLYKNIGRVFFGSLLVVFFLGTEAPILSLVTLLLAIASFSLWTQKIVQIAYLKNHSFPKALGEKIANGDTEKNPGNVGKLSKDKAEQKKPKKQKEKSPKKSTKSQSKVLDK